MLQKMNAHLDFKQLCTNEKRNYYIHIDFSDVCALLSLLATVDFFLLPKTVLTLNAVFFPHLIGFTGITQLHVGNFLCP